tara:strand:+ start:7238 stop:8143 length:906 start_codon:yes stop_codon:yes gene_type:complete
MEKEKRSLIKDLGESTAKSYAGSYMRLRKILNMTDKRKPIKKISLDVILEEIKKVDNPSTAYSVFVIAKKLFSYADNKEKFDELDKIIKERKREIQVDKNKNLNSSLPTYKEIATAVKKEQDPRKYITSFIMFKINTRNQDVALADLHAKPKENYDEKRNHLILDGNKVIFIRNVYKTAKKYGQKKNTIVVKKFADAVRDVLGDADTKPLFSRKNGEHITPASIASYLKKYVVLGLNEGQIIKAVLKYADENGSYDMLRKISANRGTGVNVLLQEYDVSNIKEPTEVITQKQEVKQTVEVE